jgi:hypothetical protein
LAVAEVLVLVLFLEMFHKIAEMREVILLLVPLLLLMAEVKHFSQVTVKRLVEMQALTQEPQILLQRAVLAA